MVASDISHQLREWGRDVLCKWNRFGRTLSIMCPKKDFVLNAASSNAVHWVWKQGGNVVEPGIADHVIWKCSSSNILWRF